MGDLAGLQLLHLLRLPAGFARTSILPATAFALRIASSSGAKHARCYKKLQGAHDTTTARECTIGSAASLRLMQADTTGQALPASWLGFAAAGLLSGTALYASAEPRKKGPSPTPSLESAVSATQSALDESWQELLLDWDRARAQQPAGKQAEACPPQPPRTELVVGTGGHPSGLQVTVLLRPGCDLSHVLLVLRHSLDTLASAAATCRRKQQVSHLPNSTLISWEVAFTPLAPTRPSKHQQHQQERYLELPPEVEQQLQQEQQIHIQAFLPNPHIINGGDKHHCNHHHNKATSTTTTNSSSSSSSAISSDDNGAVQHQEQQQDKQQQQQQQDQGDQGLEGAQLVFFKPGGVGFSAEELALLVKCMRAGNLSWGQDNSKGQQQPSWVLPGDSWVTSGEALGSPLGPLSSMFLAPLYQLLSELDEEMQQQMEGWGLGEWKGLVHKLQEELQSSPGAHAPPGKEKPLPGPPPAEEDPYEYMYHQQQQQPVPPVTPWETADAKKAVQVLENMGARVYLPGPLPPPPALSEHPSVLNKEQQQSVRPTPAATQQQQLPQHQQQSPPMQLLPPQQQQQHQQHDQQHSPQMPNQQQQQQQHQQQHQQQQQSAAHFQVLDWEQLGGYEDQKRTIEDCLLLPLQHPEVYNNISSKTRKSGSGTSRPRAVLFEGPPGTGKTTSARVLSSQAGVPLVYVPLESLGSKWYGESEGNLGKLFKCAGQLGGAIVFLDELDALATSRDKEMHEVSRRMLGVLLREIDGFETGGQRAVLIGATNRRQDLDRALLSRFDMSVYFGLPDERCRRLILQQYARQLGDDDVQQLAAATDGMSGRDLRDLCEQTERRWASKIIRKEAEPEGLPGVVEYMESVKERKRGEGQRAGFRHLAAAA